MYRAGLILFVFFFVVSCSDDRKRVLVFSKTKGFRHASISDGKLALTKLGRENHFKVDITEDASWFSEEKLSVYHAVIFLSTTEDVLDPSQQSSLKKFIQAGGGFVGIHAAADTEYEWPWFGKLVGAYFQSHPEIQEAIVRRVRPFGKASLPDNWARTDEWYNFRQISPDIKVIYNLDESTYKGGTNGANHPIAWYHEFDGGRSFYTGMGHTPESYYDALFLAHVLDGIQYAIGDKSDSKYN